MLIKEASRATNSKRVMAGLVPRLSGLILAQSEAHLSLILNNVGRWMEQVIDGAAVDEVAADQSGEDDRTLNALLCGLSQAQQQEGDECDSNLDAYSILGGADEASDLEGLLDPAEDQLDSPTSAVEISDFLGAGIEVVRQDAQHLSGVGRDPHLPP